MNRAIERFVEATAPDMPRGQRIEAVSLPLVKETAEKMGWGPGGVSASEVA